MDSSYKSDDQHIAIDWFKSNDPQRFDDDFTNSVWKITGAGVDLTDFTGTQAFSSSNKPDPIFGIISVDAYALKDLKPTPSNWVATVSPVPEPETYAMLLVGLGLVGFAARRRRAADV